MGQDVKRRSEVCPLPPGPLKRASESGYRHLKPQTIVMAVGLISLLTTTLFLAQFYLYLSNNGNPTYDLRLAGLGNNTLVWEASGFPCDVDPHLQQYNQWCPPWLLYNVYETLYAYEWDSLSTNPTVPLLAENLTISSDGLDYTFTLRQGITFHDGTPFNASCVKYNLERFIAIGGSDCAESLIRDCIKGGSAIANAIYDYGYGSAAHISEYYAWVAANNAGIGGVTVIDTYTVKLSLEEPYAPWLSILAGPIGSMISPTYVEAHGGIVIGEEDYNGWMEEHTCGTGPYMVTSWVDVESITLERYEDYWRADAAKAKYPLAGFFEKVIIKTNWEQDSRYQNVKTGAADVIDVPMDFAYELYNDVDSPEFTANDGTQQSFDPNLRVWANYPSPTIGTIHFTLNDTIHELTLDRTVENPYRSKNFRKCLSHVMDYWTVINDNTAINGFGIPGQGPIPCGMFGHDDEAFRYEYDLTRAAEYWNAAMNDDGLDDILENNSYRLIFYYDWGNELRPNCMQLLKDGIRALLDLEGTIKPSHGIDIDVIMVEGIEIRGGIDHEEAYWEAAVEGKLGCWMLGWPFQAYGMGSNLGEMFFSRFLSEHSANDFFYPGVDPNDYVVPYVKSTGFYGECARLANSAGWDAATVDGLIETAAQSHENDVREDLYRQIQNAIIEHAAYIWVYQLTTLHVCRADVLNTQYAINPMHGTYFFHCWRTYDGSSIGPVLLQLGLAGITWLVFVLTIVQTRYVTFDSLRKRMSLPSRKAYQTWLEARVGARPATYEEWLLLPSSKGDKGKG